MELGAVQLADRWLLLCLMQGTAHTADELEAALKLYSQMVASEWLRIMHAQSAHGAHLCTLMQEMQSPTRDSLSSQRVVAAPAAMVLPC